jgi:hypothetical protein
MTQKNSTGRRNIWTVSALTGPCDGCPFAALVHFDEAKVIGVDGEYPALTSICILRKRFPL